MNPHPAPADVAPPSDTRNRPLRDLRLSVTDRCNFRCGYCMPREIFGADHAFLQRAALLRFEELERLAGMFAKLGAGKLRITGGEPLVRKGIVELVARLAAVAGVTDLTMTTNGSLLTANRAAQLAAAGLSRITLSLDALDDAVFRAMNDVDFPVSRVLAAIDAARGAGLSPVKVNAVVIRGVNDHQVLPMAEHFRGSGVIVRFIEYMDVGNTNGWRMEQVFPAAQIAAAIHRKFPIAPLAAAYPGEVARRWRYLDGAGEVGIIASVTQPFCGDCTRARLSAEGKLYTCLFARHGHDLRALLRGGAGDGEILESLRSLWRRRADRYSEIRTGRTTRLPKVEMSYIGG